MDPNTNTPPPYVPPVVPSMPPVSQSHSLQPTPSINPVAATVPKQPRSRLATVTIILHIVSFALGFLAIIAFVLFFYLSIQPSSSNVILGSYIIWFFVGLLLLCLSGAASIAVIVSDALYLTKEKPTGTPRYLAITSLVIYSLSILLSILTTLYGMLFGR